MMERKSLKDLIGSQKWIKTVEETVEKRLKSARSSVDGAVEKALKRLNMPSRDDYIALLRKIQSLEKRVQKLEGVSKVRAPRGKKGEGKKSQNEPGL